jgi:hypothetical protein
LYSQIITLKYFWMAVVSLLEIYSPMSNLLLTRQLKLMIRMIRNQRPGTSVRKFLIQMLRNQRTGTKMPQQQFRTLMPKYV